MTNQNNKKLFEPVEFNRIRLNNRIVMAPMTRSRAIGSIPNDLMVSYYSQRASAGLIITEGTSPSPNGLGYARIPGIYSKEQIDGWKKVTDEVHEKKGKIFIQLMHVGRVAHAANMPENSRILAPSAISANGDMWTDSQGMQSFGMPTAMTQTDIDNTIQEFVQAAHNAIEAGFDGVEMHSANGYLLEQFLNPHANTRSDNYGLSYENRCRFAIDVSKAVASAIGKEKVGIRLSPYSTFNDMPNYDGIFSTYDYLSKELNKIDLLYIHLIDYAARNNKDGLRLIDAIRNNFGQILILNGGYTMERAEEAVTAGKADLVSFGSPFISNPNLPYKLKNNIPLTLPDTNAFYTPGQTGYTDYPFSE